MSKNNRLTRKRRRRIRPEPEEIKVEVEEAFIPTDQYHQLIGLEDTPDLASFPDGIYVVATRTGGKTRIDYYPESQIDKMEGKVIG